jgi:hypothetical protein
MSPATSWRRGVHGAAGVEAARVGFGSFSAGRLEPWARATLRPLFAPLERWLRGGSLKKRASHQLRQQVARFRPLHRVRRRVKLLSCMSS